METPEGLASGKTWAEFLSYLWGMETCYLLLSPIWNHFLVLILPMRNGNFLGQKVNSLSMTGSYPTYEEWKHEYGITNTGRLAQVLILPMRNGNIISYHICFRFFSVLILPMRNGNVNCISSVSVSCGICSYPTYEEWKHRFVNQIYIDRSRFLSYLWGMETCIFCFSELHTPPFLSYLWGMETTFKIPKTDSKLILFLSYLWGMETREVLHF